MSNNRNKSKQNDDNSNATGNVESGIIVFNRCLIWSIQMKITVPDLNGFCVQRGALGFGFIMVCVKLLKFMGGKLCKRDKSFTVAFINL